MRRAPGVAALGVCLCLLAAAFAARSLYVPGLALVLLAAAAESTTRLATRRVRLEREPQIASVQEGEEVRLTLRIRAGRLARAGELRPSPDAAPVALRRAHDGSLQLTARPERRGGYRLGPSSLRLGDPLGISRRVVRSPATDVLVLPRIVPVQTRRLAQLAGIGRERRAHSRYAAAAEADGLGPYRPGAPATRIHWPSVARTGTLLERRLTGESERLPLVVLDTRAPAGVEALDSCVRAAASLCVALARLGGAAVLLPDEQRPYPLDAKLGAWPALHTRLALVGAGGQVADAVVERAPIVLWVSAATRPEMRRRGGGGVRLLVTPFPAPGRQVLLEVAGCAVQALHATARSAA
ncbi:MAG TPA: DUF58 domain-containing protein [Solirubrobacteraceae bacterium]|nr:DUF58 domain-containing protein [Solirubrobacteraceae bacterium]